MLPYLYGQFRPFFGPFFELRPEEPRQLASTRPVGFVAGKNRIGQTVKQHNQSQPKPVSNHLRQLESLRFDHGEDSIISAPAPILALLRDFAFELPAPSELAVDPLKVEMMVGDHLAHSRNG